MATADIISFKPRAINPHASPLACIDGSKTNTKFNPRNDRLADRLTGPIHFSDFKRSKDA